MLMDVFHAIRSCLGKNVLRDGQMEFEMCTFVSLHYEAAKGYRNQDGLISSQDRMRVQKEWK